MNSRGKQELKVRVQEWAVRLKVAPCVVRVQRMTRKWGSCSTKGILTLAEDLVDQDSTFQDFVVAHEFGILSSDKDAILEKAKECGFTFVSSFYENNWISLNLRK